MAGSKQVWLVGKEHGIWKKLGAFNLYKQTGRTEEGFLSRTEQELAKNGRKMACAAALR